MLIAVNPFPNANFIDSEYNDNKTSLFSELTSFGRENVINPPLPRWTPGTDPESIIILKKDATLREKIQKVLNMYTAVTEYWRSKEFHDVLAGTKLPKTNDDQDPFANWMDNIKEEIFSISNYNSEISKTAYDISFNLEKSGKHLFTLLDPFAKITSTDYHFLVTQDVKFRNHQVYLEKEVDFPEDFFRAKPVTAYINDAYFAYEVPVTIFGMAAFGFGIALYGFGNPLIAVASGVVAGIAGKILSKYLFWKLESYEFMPFAERLDNEFKKISDLLSVNAATLKQLLDNSKK